MQIYQCPNCGRTYNEFENIYYCGNCNYRLKKQEDVKEILSPDLYNKERHIIGTTNNNSSPTVECPYCHSTNTEKITASTKVVNTVVWGIFGTKRHKNYRCNNCKSDF